MISSKQFGCLGANRFIILTLSLLFLSSNLSGLICYNATYVSMVHLESSPYYSDFLKSNQSINNIDWNDRNLPLSDRRFPFGATEKSLGFAAGFFGAILTVIPLGKLTNRFGAHKLMSIIGFISSILIFVTPTIISWSFSCFLLLRIFQGISLCNLFRIAGIVVNEWGAVNEKGLFIAVLSSHVEAGSLFTMPMAGIVASTLGWPWVFYLHGIILAVFTLLWILYYRDRPVEHPFLQENEWKKISFGKEINNSTELKTPIRKIISSIVIWCVWSAVIGNFLVSQFSISFATLYLRSVLKCEPAEAGILTLIPIGSMLFIKFSTGYFSDRITSISELAKVKLFNSLALLGSATFFAILCCSNPGNNKILDVLLFSIPFALLGFSSGGYGKCAVLVSGQYSPFVMSIVQIVACGSLMGGSLLVPALTPNETFKEWQRVFIIYGIVLTVSNTLFVIFARAHPAKWAQNQGDLLIIEAVIGKEDDGEMKTSPNYFHNPKISDEAQKSVKNNDERRHSCC